MMGGNSMKFILAYDLGTGGTKACLYTQDGVLIADEFASVQTFYPREKFHEQRPEDWWISVVQSTKKLLSTSSINPDDVVAIACSGHSLGAVPVTAEGRLLKEYCPIWSDSRGEKQAERFFKTIDEPRWYEATGCGFPAGLYAIFKIMWLCDFEPEIYRETSCFLGTKDYVNLRLTGIQATDHSYASGSGVYDLRTRGYSKHYISASGIQADKLPHIFESSDVLGTLTAQAASLLGLSQHVQVVAGGVDNACMATGAACVTDGSAYTSLGTSAWIAVASHSPIVSLSKRPYVFAHCVPGMFASATSIFSAGNSLRWIKNTFCQDLILQAEQTGADVYDLITEQAQFSPAGAHKLLFNPSLAGGSRAEKSAEIRGALLGLTLAHTRQDVLRAVLEGVAMNLRLSMDALSAIAPLSNEMLIVGGGGKSSIWRQIFADIYEKSILETNVGQDAGSLGAMACAAVGLGLWSCYDQVKAVHHLQSTKTPNATNQPIYNAMRGIFAKAADMQSDLGELLAALPTVLAHQIGAE